MGHSCAGGWARSAQDPNLHSHNTPNWARGVGSCSQAPCAQGGSHPQSRDSTLLGRVSPPEWGQHTAGLSSRVKYQQLKSIPCNRQRPAGSSRRGRSRQEPGGGREEAGRARARAMPERRWIEEDLITHFASSKAAEL